MTLVSSVGGVFWGCDGPGRLLFVSSQSQRGIRQHGESYFQATSTHLQGSVTPTLHSGANRFGLKEVPRSSTFGESLLGVIH